MALGLIEWLAPHPIALAVAVLADLAAGDPLYPAHPVRLMGRSLQALERRLRKLGADGYLGGVTLLLVLASIWVGGISAALLAGQWIHPWLGWGLHCFTLYSLLALGDLLHHGWRVERALRQGSLREARAAVRNLVGRDVDRMDEGACRRAAVESLGESLTDGFISPLFWYVVAGIPGLVLFKVVSTMDSMVGYKTPQYLRFGWCGARADDLMNWLPARITWLLVALAAAALPGYSGSKALRIGSEQHGILPSPNSGWSEAAIAGALKRRLVGPIYMNGRLVTDLWLGEAADAALAGSDDYLRAAALTAATGTLATVVSCALLTL